MEVALLVCLFIPSSVSLHVRIAIHTCQDHAVPDIPPSRLYPSIAGGFEQTWPSLQMVLTGRDSFVSAVAISCDGKRIASGSSNGIILVWDATTGVLEP
jgi:WD40 repeat protein